MIDISIIMSEPPGRCNFSCEYCYVPHDLGQRNDTKMVRGSDFLRLAVKTSAKRHLFWMCGIGEPFMMPWFLEAVTTISPLHKICAVTNLSYFGNDWPERLAALNTRNIGMYWSVHWLQMKKANVLEKTTERVSSLRRSGIKVWPTIVMHPCHFDVMGEVLRAMERLDMKISLCRYRIGQGDLAHLREEADIERKYRGHPQVDMRIWDITPEAWKVAGGLCQAGIKQVIIDAWWKICSCHGDNNIRYFGSFPEDIDKITLSPAGTCKSTRCPCKHSVFFGVNNKFPHTFADILPKWDEFING